MLSCVMKGVLFERKEKRDDLMFAIRFDSHLQIKTNLKFFSSSHKHTHVEKMKKVGEKSSKICESFLFLPLSSLLLESSIFF